jgi:hypothetical protein
MAHTPPAPIACRRYIMFPTWNFYEKNDFCRGTNRRYLRHKQALPEAQTGVTLAINKPCQVHKQTLPGTSHKQVLTQPRFSRGLWQLCQLTLLQCGKTRFLRVFDRSTNSYRTVTACRERHSGDVRATL